jgi:hypothetical protein
VMPKPGSSTTTTMSASRKVQPDMIYEKPKTYMSPAARTTPSKQEYISPGTRDSRGLSGQETDDNTRKIYTTTPERKTNVSGGNSTRESGSNTRYSATPSQKYSAPDRPSSRNTYSAPSSSGTRSYSAPSSGSSGGGATRSGGGGSSSSGGSSSGGGSHSSGGGSSRGGR